MAIDFPFPPRYIVGYINDILVDYNIANNGSIVPIIASTPSNTDDIWKEIVASPNTTPLLIQYDRLMRFRPNSFYPIKREQVVLYLYGQLSTVNDVAIIIQNLLDREDVAGQDVNSWAKRKANEDNKIQFNNSEFSHNVFFHSIKVYQVDESRDVTDLVSTRSIYVNKIIIEYDYHVKSSSILNSSEMPINY